MLNYLNFSIGQVDFIIFIFLSLGIAFFLLKSLKNNFNTRPSNPVILTFFLLLGFSYPTTKFFSDKEKDQVIKMLKGFAPTYALEFQQMGHEKLGLDTKANDPNYLELIKTEIKWEEVNPAIADVYTLKKKEDGSIYFMVDSETDYNGNGIYDGDKEQRTAIGEKYEITHAMAKAFEGISIFDPVVNIDRWGAWVSAYSPIFNKKGKVDGVVGVDYRAEDYLRSYQLTRFFVLGIFFFLIILLNAYSWITSEVKWNMKKQEEAQNAINAGKTRLEMALKASLQGIFEWNESSETLYFTNSFYTVLGRNPGDFPMTPQSWNELTHPDDLELGWNRILFLIETNTSDICVFRMKHAKGNWRWMEVKLYFIQQTENESKKDQKNKNIVLGFLTDITEMKELQQQMIHSEKLATVGTLAAGVAHEINNPLFIIKGLVSMLTKKISDASVPNNEDYIKILQKQDNAINRIVDIVKGLKVYARTDNETEDVVDFHQVIHDTLSLIKNIFEKEGIKIALNLNSTQYKIKGNAGKFQQVIMNLLINAKDAFEGIDKEKIITLATEDDNDTFLLSIQDNGCGIDENNLSHIFDPFFTTKEPGKGTGLGLAICRSLISSFKGTISAKSKFGAGTKFSITFPINKESEDKEKLAS